jgi:hypothetical protein
LRTGNTYHGEDILFRDAEKVVPTMSSQEVNDLAQGLEKRSLYEREGPYDHIGNWFAPQLAFRSRGERYFYTQIRRSYSRK